jgi:hypothetical protein
LDNGNAVWPDYVVRWIGRGTISQSAIFSFHHRQTRSSFPLPDDDPLQKRREKKSLVQATTNAPSVVTANFYLTHPPIAFNFNFVNATFSANSNFTMTHLIFPVPSSNRRLRCSHHKYDRFIAFRQSFYFATTFPGSEWM